MISLSRISILKSVCVFVLGLLFFMTSNVAVAEEEITISVETFEKLMTRLDRLEAELAALKDEKKKQDSMVEAELAELKDEKKKQDSMVEAELAALKDEKKKQDSMVEAALKEEKGLTAGGADIDSSGYYAQAQALFLQAYSSRSTAGVIKDTGFLDADDTIITADFDQEWDVGYRVEIGYMPQQGLGWAARYWHFDQEQSVQFGGDVEAVFFDDPDIDIDDNGGRGILAKREFDLDVGDIAATFVTRSGNTMVKYSAGIRVLDSDMTGFWSDNQPTGERIKINNDWTGAGPLLGFDITHPLFQNSTILLNAYAGGSVAMLYGDGDFVIVEGNADALPLDDEALAIERDAGIVYNSELRFGLEAIMKPSQKSLIEYFVKLGFEGQYWAGIGTMAAGPTGGSDFFADDILLDADLGLVGGTVMLGVRGEF